MTSRNVAIREDVYRKLLEAKREGESFSLLNLDNAVVEAYCDLYQKMRKEGTPIPDADLVIAATAISRDMAIKTRDGHFKKLRTHGLKLE